MTTIETDILPPESKNAIILAIPERDALPPSLLANIETNFVGFFTQAEKWRQQALSINITSADQKTEMKLARTIRLALKEVRVTAEKKRVELKKDVNLMAKAIDGANNMLLAAITPLENHLKEQEEFAERLAEEQRQRTIAERHEKLEKEIAAQKAAEAAAAAAKLAAEKAAAAAPDKAKLEALADAVRALPMPKIQNEGIAETIIDKIEAFAKWIETQASKL